jgi:hypothetical protein
MSYSVGDILKQKFELDELPNDCPYCFKAIQPKLIAGFFNEGHEVAEIFMHCPDKECYSTFIGYYNANQSNRLHTVIDCEYSHTGKGSIRKSVFNDIIVNYFSRFCEIYNEAYHSEQEGLFQICGVGYRKALEILVKDYIIKKSPEKKNLIIKTALFNCINDHIDNSNIREVAKRATWLGNDETHYEKEFLDKDVTHLKDLISLMVSWIEMEEKTSKYIAEIPSKKK